MTMAEVVEFISRFAAVSARAGAHAHHGHLGHGEPTTATTSPRATATFAAARVVLASGACNLPSVPALRAGACRRRSSSVTPFDYRNPDQLPEGGVLVVGASATGVQLADEIHRSGRPVTLSVGEHVRLPRTYRGRDVLWWMDASGVWNQRYDEIDDLTRARRLPSPQLVGTPERTTLDLNALSAIGRRARRPAGRRARRPGALLGRAAQPCSRSPISKMDRLLDTFDEWARDATARDADVGAAGALRADPRAGLVAAAARSAERRDPFDRLGDRVSSGLQLARRAGRRREGPPAARRRRRRRARGCMRSGCRCCGGASRPSSTAPRTTRATSSITSPAISTGRNVMRPGGFEPPTRGLEVRRSVH